MSRHPARFQRARSERCSPSDWALGRRGPHPTPTRSRARPTRKARWVVAEARDLLGGNGIRLENHDDAGAIVGIDITGVGAFT
jgi:hypothetical protein